MNRTALIEGKRYIIEPGGGRRVSATYEGRHGGVLVLADGSTFRGSEGALRFSYTDAEGVEQVVLFEKGTPVVEPEETRIARERAEVEQKEREAASLAEATAFLESLGLTVVDRRAYWTLDDEARRATVTINRSDVDPDEIDIDSVTVGKIKLAVANAKEVVRA